MKWNFLVFCAVVSRKREPKHAGWSFVTGEYIFGESGGVGNFGAQCFSISVVLSNVSIRRFLELCERFWISWNAIPLPRKTTSSRHFYFVRSSATGKPNSARRFSIFYAFWEISVYTAERLLPAGVYLQQRTYTYVRESGATPACSSQQRVWRSNELTRARARTARKNDSFLALLLSDGRIFAFESTFSLWISFVSRRACGRKSWIKRKGVLLFLFSCKWNCRSRRWWVSEKR